MAKLQQKLVNFDEVRNNNLKSIWLFFLFMVVIGFLGFIVGLIWGSMWLGLILALIFGLVYGLIAYFLVQICYYHCPRRSPRQRRTIHIL